MGEKLCNLCDRSFEYIQTKDISGYERVVVGSYSCFNYFTFLFQKEMSFINQEYDIVIPIIPQMQLEIMSNKKMCKVTFTHLNKIYSNSSGLFL